MTASYPTIGHCGMGVVYAALDERLGRRVAIKTIRGGADSVARERLWREARVAASATIRTGPTKAAGRP